MPTSPDSTTRPITLSSQQLITIDDTAEPCREGVPALTPRAFAPSLSASTAAEAPAPPSQVPNSIMLNKQQKHAEIWTEVEKIASLAGKGMREWVNDGGSLDDMNVKAVVEAVRSLASANANLWREIHRRKTAAIDAQLEAVRELVELVGIPDVGVSEVSKLSRGSGEGAIEHSSSSAQFRSHKMIRETSDDQESVKSCSSSGSSSPVPVSTVHSPVPIPIDNCNSFPAPSSLAMAAPLRPTDQTRGLTLPSLPAPHLPSPFMAAASIPGRCFPEASAQSRVKAENLRTLSNIQPHRFTHLIEDSQYFKHFLQTDIHKSSFEEERLKDYLVNAALSSFRADAATHTG